MMAGRSPSATTTTPVQLGISEFDASLEPMPYLERDSRRRTRNWSGALGLIGTLVLHALAMQALGLQFGAHKPRTAEPFGIFANQARSVVVPAEELVLITLQDTPTQRFDLQHQIASLAPKVKPFPISITSPDLLPVAKLGDPSDATDEASTKVSDEVDPSTRALMLERYLGQIRARVQQAWTQSRAPARDKTLSQTEIGDSPNDIFKCRVQIRQDARGNVLEVLLLKCEGAEEWRKSIVTAIYQASPLNAPPIP